MPEAGTQADVGNYLVMGRIASVHGIKGWVKVFSFTDPPSNILEYRRWRLRHRDGHWESVVLTGGRIQGKGLVASFEGVDDREHARSFSGAEVFVEQASLPPLDEGEYYWHQLQGLSVLAWRADEDEGEPVLLGKVINLIETGANDVLVIKGAAADGVSPEHLVPWVDHVIVDVDLAQRKLLVRWDPDF